jgi:dTDP-3-amino-2,3,6-trideoxy-4-keto-D-glucose/dTDP-3-amino-3,4,6-trideoxy-alpha-D-glucose/dTDP-2,6-dideoxy-D-kanosamine transaminase
MSLVLYVMKSINDLKRQSQELREEILAAMSTVLDRGWFSLGPEVAAFEQEFADYCGVGFCVGVANGTDALEIALRAINIAPSDSVICVANAGGYSSHAIRSAGAHPIFVDVDFESMNMSARALDEVLRGRKAPKPVKAVIFTHLYGNTHGIAAVADVCRQHKIALIEDCAQAHGAAFAGRRVGAWGDMACFSFYPTKNLGALGDGGAVVTSGLELATKLRHLRQYGWAQRKYVTEVRGSRNSRLDELQAAVLRVKLRVLDQKNEQRRRVASKLSSGLINADVRRPRLVDPEALSDHVAHLYVVSTPDRDSFKAHLQLHEIGCDVHYPVPDHQQPAWKVEYESVALPVTERLAAEVLTLPCFPEMTDAEINTVVAAVHGWRSTGVCRTANR